MCSRNRRSVAGRQVQVCAPWMGFQVGFQCLPCDSLASRLIRGTSNTMASAWCQRISSFCCGSLLGRWFLARHHLLKTEHDPNTRKTHRLWLIHDIVTEVVLQSHRQAARLRPRCRETETVAQTWAHLCGHRRRKHGVWFASLLCDWSLFLMLCGIPKGNSAALPLKSCEITRDCLFVCQCVAAHLCSPSPAGPAHGPQSH